MKLATATFLLGASSVAADLGSGQSATFIDGSGTEVIMTNNNDDSVSIPQVAGHSIACVRSERTALPSRHTTQRQHSTKLLSLTFPRDTVVSDADSRLLCSVKIGTTTLASNGGPARCGFR